MPIKILIAAAVIAGLGSPALAADVTVNVHDVASAKGEVLIALCREAEFLKACALSAKVRAARGVVTVTFRNVAPGRYGGMAFHDENSNEKLDRTQIGVPSEGAAFSRDAMGVQGPPSFADAVVDVPAKGAAVDINLVYY